MLFPNQPIIIYAASSIRLWSDIDKEKYIIKPPVKRGDLESLIQKHDLGTCVLIDGLFGGKMAVSPTECRLLLEKGWHVLGCSSMGALRAADLWNVGMIGIGNIYNMYRLGYAESDAEVAVLYNQQTYDELTISLVHIKYILAHLLKQDAIPLTLAQSLLQDAAEEKWFDRTHNMLQQKWQKYDSEIVSLITHLLADKKYHPKLQDAATMLEYLKLKDLFYPNSTFGK